MSASTFLDLTFWTPTKQQQNTSGMKVGEGIIIRPVWAIWFMFAFIHVIQGDSKRTWTQNEINI